jgi:rSAM/selenodomain-associated transferase 1
MKNILLIFIKNPLEGRVKTRLARTVGDAGALKIYRFLLEKTREAALGMAAERWLFYSDFVEKRDDWPAEDFQKYVQHGPDLGARMENAFRQAFAAGAARAVIIGSDCPELSPAILQQAFISLDRHDFVLGPTPDGGYYLLGMKAPEPALFKNMPWSTPAVRALTLEKIKELKKSAALLKMLTDIDEEPDWNRYCGR